MELNFSSLFGESLNVYSFFLISYPIICLLGFLSFKFIEKPCLKWKQDKIALKKS